MTISIPEGNVWDDGEPITIDDIVFPYYVIGHPDYTGVRYGTDFSTVVGMEEYHSGETDKIEDHEYMRVNPIGFGPFKVDSIVPGESIFFQKMRIIGAEM